MRRVVSYILIILVLGTIFGLSLHQTKGNMGINSITGIISPVVAYADSDTVGEREPPPPPPIVIR
jgi:hypothetical protein|uniref:Uncharacterized protein n=1 Tax=candidate division WOR-3 bacterium TaxID=2052148 RepID=A0A7V3RIF9_UNCW3